MATKLVVNQGIGKFNLIFRWRSLTEIQQVITPQTQRWDSVLEDQENVSVFLEINGNGNSFASY